MIQLTSKELSQVTLDELIRRQDVINGKGGFAQQSSYTQTAWKGKKGSNAGQAELLHLNKRGGLVDARRKAALYYQDRLNRYVRVLNSANFDELDEAIDPIEILDKSLDFQAEKEKYLRTISHDIMSYCHPTVWKEMIRQRGNYEKLKALFEQAPEALLW